MRKERGISFFKVCAKCAPKRKRGGFETLIKVNKNRRNLTKSTVYVSFVDKKDADTLVNFYTYRTTKTFVI